MLADVCRQIALTQRFTRFLFLTLWSQNCQFGHLFKVIKLTTFPTARGTFKNSIKGQLVARELPRIRALLEDFLRRNRSWEGLKNKKRRIPFHLESSLVPLHFEASRDLCVATTVKKRANPPRGRTEKTWLWFAASNQNATIITNQILRLSSVRVCQTNNDCAQAYFSLCSPFSILGSSSFPSACNYFWLALTLCQYHHPRWRQGSTEIHYMSALQAKAMLGWLFTRIYEKRAQK